MPFVSKNKIDIRKIVFQKKMEKIRFHSQEYIFDELKTLSEQKYNKLLEIKKITESLVIEEDLKVQAKETEL